MLRRNIASTSLKVVCKMFYSVEWYDKSNINVFIYIIYIKSMGKFKVVLNLF